MFPKSSVLDASRIVWTTIVPITRDRDAMRGGFYRVRSKRVVTSQLMCMDASLLGSRGHDFTGDSLFAFLT